MFRRGFFKVEEIGTAGIYIGLYFKGKRRIFFEEEELVRSMIVSSRKCLNEIISLTEGKLNVEAEFARNVFKLTGNGIKEIRIIKKTMRKGGAYTMSNLKLLDNSSISEVLPQHAVKYLLVCKGIGRGGDIYCHEDLYEPPENMYDEKRRDEAIKRLESMKNYFIFFKRIKDIEFADETPKVHVNKDEYEKLRIDQISGHPLIMGAALPSIIIYKKGSKNYGIQFPMNRATFSKFSEDRGLDPSGVVYSDDPFYPGFLLESMSIIDRVMKRAKIQTESIYVDGTIKTHTRTRLGNLIIYTPRSAKIILEKNGQKMVTPAPWGKAISLSYLNSKDVWIRSLTESYTV